MKGLLKFPLGKYSQLPIVFSRNIYGGFWSLNILQILFFIL